MKIINLEFPIFWYGTFFMFKTSLLLLNFCLCVYIEITLWASNQCILTKLVAHFWIFCGCRGFCHRTESDLFLVLTWLPLMRKLCLLHERSRSQLTFFALDRNALLCIAPVIHVYYTSINIWSTEVRFWLSIEKPFHKKQQIFFDKILSPI